jgi:hypothetical protein
VDVNHVLIAKKIEKINKNMKSSMEIKNLQRKGL